MWFLTHSNERSNFCLVSDYWLGLAGLFFFWGGGEERETLLSLFALVSIRYATNLPFPALLLSN